MACIKLRLALLLPPQNEKRSCAKPGGMLHFNNKTAETLNIQHFPPQTAADGLNSPDTVYCLNILTLDSGYSVKLDPIDPQEFTRYAAYQEKKRTHWERFLDKVKPRSAAMRTTVLVLSVVFFSLFMSLWFFWRTLYLPEIQQHARYLALELEVLNNPELRMFHNNAEVDIEAWLKNRVGVEYVTDPKEYPSVREKVIAEFFTNQIEDKLSKELKIDQATVYFQFKPSPRIWVQTPEMNGNWVREPLKKIGRAHV